LKRNPSNKKAILWSRKFYSKIYFQNYQSTQIKSSNLSSW